MAAKYRAYPEYKDSGVEWVGAIPHNWRVEPLYAISDSECIKNENGAEDNVLSLSYGNIIKRDVKDNYGLLPESFNTYQLVKVGDIILRLTDLQNDKRSLRVGQAKEKGIITSAYLKLVARKNDLNSRFFYRLLHSYDTTKVFYGMGGGLRQSMKFEDMRRLPLLVPSLSEQEQIANFLDHETAKIDTLIEKQQQLIALLKEKRQAVISHAVTKGLNPYVKMKDSGVEWLGEVPEGWKVGRLGYYAKVSNGATPNRENKDFWENGDIPWLNSSKVNDIFVTTAEQFITKTALLKTSVQSVKENDILMAITGEGQTRGRVAICKIRATINQHLAAISITDKSLKYDFLFLWLRSQYERLRFESDGGGATKAAITCSEIIAFPVIIPTDKEQEEITNYIFQKNKQFDKLEEKAQQQIELLQERRTALISAAVTGKIDVREWRT